MEQNRIVGHGFSPTDHQLVDTYLRAKLHGLPTYCDYITELDIYNLEPWDLAEFSRKRSEDGVLYFICPCNYVSSKSLRRKRTTQAGYWKPTGRHRRVNHEITDKEIGKKRSLVFHFGRHKDARTEWVMHEYEYTENCSKGGTTSKSDQGDFVLCKIMKSKKRVKSASSFNTSISLMEQNEDFHLMTPSKGDKNKSSFNMAASTSNQNISNLLMTSEIIDKNESSFNTLIPVVNQTEASYLVASLPENEGGYNTLTSPNIRESRFNTLIFTVDEMDLNHPMVFSKKSESSFNVNTSSNFYNENEDQIMANAAMYENEANYPMASADIAKASFDFGNQTQDLMIIDYSLPYEKADESESSFNINTSSDFFYGSGNQIMANAVTYENEASYLVASTDIAQASFDFMNQNQNLMISDFALPCEKVDKSESSFNTSISSSFASKETNSAMFRNEDNYTMPSDLRNHMPDKDDSVSYDSAYFHLSDFKDQSAWTNQAICSKENQSLELELGDCQDFNSEDLLNFNFQEEIVQEVDFSQLILPSTNCEHAETSMNKDFNQNQQMCSNIPTIDSGSDVLEELEAFF